MANGATQDQNWDRAHSDIAVVAQRVTNIENSVAGVENAIRDLSKKLEAKPTDIWKIISGVAGLLALVGAFLYQGKAYIDADLERHDREIGRLIETAVSKDEWRISLDQQQRRNLEADAARDKLRDQIESSRVETARADGRESERHEEYVRDHAALVAHVDAIDGNLIKRPELEASFSSQRELTTLTNAGTGSRIDAVIGSMNELRHDFGASFTIGDRLKGLEQEIADLRKSGVAAPVPLAPVAPAQVSRP